MALPPCTFSNCNREAIQEGYATAAVTGPKATSPSTIILIKSSSINLAALAANKYVATVGSDPNTRQIAGLQPTDKILSVNGVDVSDSPDHAAKLLVGKYGSQVDLKVLRGTSTVTVHLALNTFLPDPTDLANSVLIKLNITPKDGYVEATIDKPLMANAVYCIGSVDDSLKGFFYCFSVK